MRVAAYTNTHLTENFHHSLVCKSREVLYGPYNLIGDWFKNVFRKMYLFKITFGFKMLQGQSIRFLIVVSLRQNLVFSAVYVYELFLYLGNKGTSGVPAFDFSDNSAYLVNLTTFFKYSIPHKLSSYSVWIAGFQRLVFLFLLTHDKTISQSVCRILITFDNYLCLKTCRGTKRLQERSSYACLLKLFSSQSKLGNNLH